MKTKKKNCAIPLNPYRLSLWAGLFKSRLTLTWGYKLTEVSVSLVKKTFSLLILSYSLVAAKVEILDKTDIQESTSLSYKTEFKIDANPGLA